MARKTIGYVELEWTCKRCGTKNPGTQKTCSGCGAAMSEQDQFDLPAQQALVTDEELLVKAESGVDIHCPYCGARNPAGTEICSQCGAGLAEAQAREHGRVVGAFKAGPAADIPCPSCGTLNPASAASCRNCGGNLPQAPSATQPTSRPAAGTPTRSRARLIGILFGLVLIAGLIFVFALGSRKQDVPAVVQSVKWERSIQIMELRPVEREDWKDQLPESAQLGACTQKYRRTQADPAPGAEEVCGTPYTVDKGSGLGEVVQDCEYKIYDNWCTFTLEEWESVDQAIAQGADLNPAWPALSLQASQRQGDRAEGYKVYFEADGDHVYTYSAGDTDEFSQFTLGSQWMLKVNGLGGVTAVQKR